MGGKGSGPQPGYRRPKPDPRVIGPDDKSDLTASQKREIVRIVLAGGTYEDVCKELEIPLEKLRRNIRVDADLGMEIKMAWIDADPLHTLEVEMALLDKTRTGDTRSMEKWLDNRDKERWAPATKLDRPNQTNIGTLVLNAGQSLQNIQELEAKLLKRRELGSGQPDEPEILEAEVLD